MRLRIEVPLWRSRKARDFQSGDPSLSLGRSDLFKHLKVYFGDCIDQVLSISTSGACGNQEAVVMTLLLQEAPGLHKPTPSH